MKIVAGLGNPGRQYENTRHNLGFKVIDRLAGIMGVSVIKAKHKALIGDKMLNGEKVMLVKPMTFMNLSGECIREVISYYNIPIEDIIIVYDDCALSPGSIRVRESGSDGGHNGIKSIIKCIGTQKFARIRIGIGKKPPEWDLADYVLSGFSDEEKHKTEEAVADACDCASLMLMGRTAEAMNKYNRKAAEAPTGDEKN